MAPLITTLPAAAAATGSGIPRKVLEYRVLIDMSQPLWFRMVSVLLWAVLLSLIGHIFLVLSFMLCNWIWNGLTSWRTGSIRLEDQAACPQAEQPVLAYCIDPSVHQQEHCAKIVILEDGSQLHFTPSAEKIEQ